MELSDLPVRDGWGEWQRVAGEDGFHTSMVQGNYGVIGAPAGGAWQWKVVYAEDGRPADWHTYDTAEVAMKAAERRA